MEPTLDRGIAAAMLLPLVPMTIRVVSLALGDDRFYADQGVKGNLIHKLVLQAKSMPEAIDTRLVLVLFAIAAITVLAAWSRRGTDWISIGVLAVGFGTVVFAAKVGVITSRYYLPALCATALVVARSAERIGPRAMVAVAAALLLLAVIQVHGAHRAVGDWVAGEPQPEQVVREAAARLAGGCRVNATGSNAEMVKALPVLAPLAREQPRSCNGHERFVVVIDGGGNWVSNATNDSLIEACEPAAQVGVVGSLARILRCSAA